MSVLFVGDGESKENLQLFDGERFLTALFQDNHSNVQR
jgi:signal recognition particle GTPase